MSSKISYDHRTFMYIYIFIEEREINKFLIKNIYLLTKK